MPDALIRPRLAALTTGMPASLYFIGFTGGVLSVGVVGVIAGPLVIALLAETVQLLSPERPPCNDSSSSQTVSMGRPAASHSVRLPS
jgi:predicted PurR-regulated permease PerM